MLDKDTIKLLEYTTIPVVSIVTKTNKYPTILKYFVALSSWYVYHEVDINSVKNGWNKLTELLGKPAYYITYNYKNAVWGIEWNNYPVLIYYDKRGLAIQITKDFPVEKVIPLYKYLLTDIFKISEEYITNQFNKLDPILNR